VRHCGKLPSGVPLDVAPSDVAPSEGATVRDPIKSCAVLHCCRLPSGVLVDAEPSETAHDCSRHNALHTVREKNSSQRQAKNRASEAARLCSEEKQELQPCSDPTSWIETFASKKTISDKVTLRGTRNTAAVCTWGRLPRICFQQKRDLVLVGISFNSLHRYTTPPGLVYWSQQDRHANHASE
jgi:hypothetical protein